MASIEPPARDGASTAYDSARGKTVLFGGRHCANSTCCDGDTWEWDGSTWVQVATIGPSARYMASMAYDCVRRKTILFGGYGLSGPLGDTWEWDGRAWKQTATTGPTARSGASMAFDAANGRALLFGGAGMNGSVSDTWQWDGSGWTQIATSGPRARAWASMVYDSARHSMVLFGGMGAVDLLSDTWEFGTGHLYTINDALSALRVAGGATTVSPEAMKFLDVIQTGPSAGRVDLQDAIRIGRMAVGLDTSQ